MIHDIWAAATGKEPSLTVDNRVRGTIPRLVMTTTLSEDNFEISEVQWRCAVHAVRNNAIYKFTVYLLTYLFTFERCPYTCSRRYLRVSRELENAEDAKHPQRDEGAAERLVVGDSEPNVVGQDRHHVDDAHHGAHVAIAVGRREQPKQILAGEDHHARRVQTEQLHLEDVAARPTASGRRQLAAARDRLGDVDDNGDGDEEAGDVVEHEGRRSAVRRLEGPPHSLAVRRLWSLFQRLLHLQTPPTFVPQHPVTSSR